METESLKEALERVKTLLGITDGGSDMLLSVILEDVYNLILGYCRLEAMPRQLWSLLPIIAVDVYRAKGYGQKDAPEDIKSVSEGQRSYSIESGRMKDEEILSNYYKRLMPYRNMRGRVPSEI